MGVGISPLNENKLQITSFSDWQGLYFCMPFSNDSLLSGVQRSIRGVMAIKLQLLLYWGGPCGFSWYATEGHRWAQSFLYYKGILSRKFSCANRLTTYENWVAYNVSFVLQVLFFIAVTNFRYLSICLSYDIKYFAAIWVNAIEWGPFELSIAILYDWDGVANFYSMCSCGVWIS